ncbi:sigma factor [Streptosporangium canum]|uniref:sigma factor n=1 Tax=Streptosporangium canum TaxID=324952 RepID=UPI003445847E
MRHRLRLHGERRLRGAARPSTETTHEVEDAVQEASLAAATHLPAGGIPENPRSWLVTVASRRLVDRIRSKPPRNRMTTIGTCG